MKTEETYERALRIQRIVQWVVGVIIGAMVALFLTSCAPEEVYKPSDKVNNLFTVTGAPRGFYARIAWGVNKMEYNDPVTGGLSYSSAAYLASGDHMLIRVESGNSLTLTFSGVAGLSFTLEPGVLYMFNQKLEKL